MRAWLTSDPPRRLRFAQLDQRPGHLCQDPFPSLTEHAYAYLLGAYLGDGHLVEMRRGVWALRIFLDAIHPRIVAEVACAVSLIGSSHRCGVYASSRARMKIVTGYSKHWPCLFPQHGPGMKHKRAIALAHWQTEICRRFPDRLLRGLIHSDGCRSINVIRHPKRTYRYPRYEFCNRSDDIRGIFCAHCDQLGIEWRRMNRWTVSVARRGSVAELDRLVGAKG